MAHALINFIDQITEKIRPLSEAYAGAGYQALLTGKAEDYQRSSELMIEVVKVFSDQTLAKEFFSIKESYTLNDPIILRCAAILEKEFKRNAGDPTLLQEIVERQTEIENRFSVFRTQVNNQQLTDNQVEDILENSTDLTELQEVWEASKQIGTEVAEKIIQLAELRNRLAVSNGYNNFHDMSLLLDEQNPAEMTSLFDRLNEMTLPAYRQIKSEIDNYLSSRLGCSISQLRPWCYQNRYFQEAPKIYPFNPDSIYEKADILSLTKDYFQGIGLDISSILQRSDMYEREGKYQHACCNTIVRNSDVRVIMNLRSNYKWMNTSLHEFGHAVYDGCIDETLPWLLKEPAHIFTTEAIAMLFGGFALTPAWIDAMLPDVALTLGFQEREVLKNSLRNEQIIFSRWAQVVYRFEAGMYANPRGNLNALWKQLTEKYQLLSWSQERDAPDWASKIHIAAYPCYYHNYQLGELFASQLLTYIGKHFCGNAEPGSFAFAHNTEAGDYLRKHVFFPGNRYRWDDLIRRATGEPLNPAYYATQFK